MEGSNSVLKFGSSAAGVTDESEACPRHWYAARVRMKCEKATAARITCLGYETYVPVQQELRQWSDRKKKIERILIPLIVFFKSDEAGLRQVQRLSYVYDLVKSPGSHKAAAIPGVQIERLRFMTDHSEVPVSIESPGIRVGDRVRVLRGSLKGLEGYATTGTEGHATITIVIENLFCASVRINPQDVAKL